MNKGLNEVMVIAGPTASGKSGLALALAQHCGGRIINADSLQLYAALPILTAQPDAASLKAAPHRLYGMLGADEKPTAAWWAAKAGAEISQSLAEGLTPILVGGTGLYLETLINGLAALPDIPASARVEIEQEFSALGAAAFYARLIEKDPNAARLKPGDTQRVKRAGEVLLVTGRSLFSWQEAPQTYQSPFSFRSFVILPPREILYAACNARFIDMLARGAMEEVESFLKSNDQSAPVARALGFKSLAASIHKKISYEAAVAETQQLTRNYAKRQMTWFRNRAAKLNNATILESSDAGFCLPKFNRDKR